MSNHVTKNQGYDTSASDTSAAGTNPLNLLKANDVKAIKNLLLSKEHDPHIVYGYTEFAIKYGCSIGIVKILVNELKKQKFSETELVYDTFNSSSFDDRFTLVGLAIDHKHLDALKHLIESGYCITSCYKKTKYSEKNPGPLCVYLDSRSYRKGDHKMLQYIFSQKPPIETIASDHVFNLGVHTSWDEFVTIMNSGISIDSKFKEESKTQNGDKTDIFYICEVNLFDLVVMNAEFKNVMNQDRESIEKVRYMIQRNVDVLTRNNHLDTNFLHTTHIPELCELFASKGVPVDHKALCSRYRTPRLCEPIKIQYNDVVIDILVRHGADKKDASYVRESETYDSNLKRIKYDPARNDKLFLVECMKHYDVPAFISLIASGIDVNKTVTDGRWTALHHAFAEADRGSVCDNYDFISICTENQHLQFANILIKHKAKPLKDAMGRTPLMCMSFHAHNLPYTQKVIELYIDYEADYHGLNREEYREKFFALRSGGYKSIPTMMGLGPSVSAPMKDVFDAFWESFKTKIKFAPKKSHDPIRSWNEMTSRDR